MKNTNDKSFFDYYQEGKKGSKKLSGKHARKAAKSMRERRKHKDAWLYS